MRAFSRPELELRSPPDELAESLIDVVRESWISLGSLSKSGKDSLTLSIKDSTFSKPPFVSADPTISLKIPGSFFWRSVVVSKPEESAVPPLTSLTLLKPCSRDSGVAPCMLVNGLISFTALTVDLPESPSETSAAMPCRCAASWAVAKEAPFPSSTIAAAKASSLFVARADLFAAARAKVASLISASCANFLAFIASIAAFEYAISAGVARPSSFCISASSALVLAARGPTPPASFFKAS